MMEMRSIACLGRRFAAYLGIAALAGCTGLPGWLDERIRDRPEADLAPVEYPDLADLPSPPALPPSDAEFAAARGELERARASNIREGEKLDEEIENDFEFLDSSSN
jgi:hypothetical protein